jgi:TetR/AcrR family transcriptional regulator, cholesterol catabolism regulator
VSASANATTATTATTAAAAAPLNAPRRPRGRPRKTLQERDDGNRRQELIRAAAGLFRAKGFAATGTRDIAAAVGMHSGSPFYHFKSKSALLCEVMEQGMRSALARQSATLRALHAAPPEARLRALIRTHFDILLGAHSSFVPVMLYEWRSLTPDQRAAIIRLQHDYEAAWLPLLRALKQQRRLHADPRLARLLLLGALNWSVRWYNRAQGATLDQLTDAAMSLFVAPALP